MILGLPYIPEVYDCYQAARRYFEPFGIHLRDYAFPSDFWAYEDDLYGRLFKREGFYEVDLDDWTPQVGDVLMVRGSQAVEFATHIGILVEGNKVYHHYTDRASEASDFKGIWRRPIRVVRHKDFKSPEPEVKRIDITELMPPHVRARFGKSAKIEV